MKPRHHLYLDDELTARLQELARRPGASKSGIVAAALKAFLDARAENALEQHFRLRLDRMSRQLDRIERDLQVLLESLGLFIRFQLTVTAPVPENDHAMKAIGRDRFRSFVDQVARQLGAGRSSLRPAEEGGDGETMRGAAG